VAQNKNQLYKMQYIICTKYRTCSIFLLFCKTDSHILKFDNFDIYINQIFSLKYGDTTYFKLSL
jgi:hypothetical protein